MEALIGDGSTCSLRGRPADCNIWPNGTVTLVTLWSLFSRFDCFSVEWEQQYTAAHLLFFQYI